MNSPNMYVTHQWWVSDELRLASTVTSRWKNKLTTLIDHYTGWIHLWSSPCLGQRLQKISREFLFCSHHSMIPREVKKYMHVHRHARTHVPWMLNAKRRRGWRTTSDRPSTSSKRRRTRRRRRPTPLIYNTRKTTHWKTTAHSKKKVPLRDRKRRTASCLASTRFPVRGVPLSWLGERYPYPGWGERYPYPGWGRGTPILAGSYPHPPKTGPGTAPVTGLWGK